MKKLRVLALMHADLVPPDSLEGLSEEQTSEWRTEFDVVKALKQLGHEVQKLGVSDDVTEIRNAVMGFKPDVAFNLLVEFHGAGTYDQHVASYLELLRTNYTGCNPRGLTLARDKALAKEILTYRRVRVPRSQTFVRGRRVRRLARLRFPLFVKSVSEEASLGISTASLVRDDEDAALRNAAMEIYVKVGPAAVPALLALLRDDDEEIRNFAAVMLGARREGQNPSAVAILRVNGQDPDMCRRLPHFKDLTATDPDRRFRIAAEPNADVSRDGELAISIVTLSPMPIDSSRVSGSPMSPSATSRPDRER